MTWHRSFSAVGQSTDSRLLQSTLLRCLSWSLSVLHHLVHPIIPTTITVYAASSAISRRLPTMAAPLAHIRMNNCLPGSERSRWQSQRPRNGNMLVYSKLSNRPEWLIMTIIRYDDITENNEKEIEAILVIHPSSPSIDGGMLMVIVQCIPIPNSKRFLPWNQRSSSVPMENPVYHSGLLWCIHFPFRSSVVLHTGELV